MGAGINQHDLQNGKKNFDSFLLGGGGTSKFVLGNKINKSGGENKNNNSYMLFILNSRTETEIFTIHNYSQQNCVVLHSADF